MSVPKNLIDLALKLAKLGGFPLSTGVTTEVLNDFEFRFGVPIPDQLAEWLLFTNGSQIADFSRMVGIGKKENDIWDVESYYNVCPILRDNGWIPVADDGCGNLYLILTQTISGPSNPVAFLDHEKGYDLDFVVASELWYFWEGLLNRELFIAEMTATWSREDFREQEFPEYWWPHDKEKVLEFDPDIEKVPLNKPWDGD